MPTSRAQYLLDQLICNSLTYDELGELTKAIGANEMTPEYSDLLEKYFYQLLENQDVIREKKSNDRM